MERQPVSQGERVGVMPTPAARDNDRWLRK